MARLHANKYENPQDRWMAMPKPYFDIHWERIKAWEKHGHEDYDMESVGWQHYLRLPVLVEEVGEVGKAIIEEGPEELRKELVQVAAMAAAWIDAIDQRED